MRRLIVGIAVIAATALIPLVARADNQKVAEQIALSLRDSGQLQNYKIGVKFQEGTAWVKGRVDSREQMNAALKLAFETSGVERVINNLEIGPAEQQAVARPNVGGLQAAYSHPMLPANPPVAQRMASVAAPLPVQKAAVPTPAPVAPQYQLKQASGAFAAERLSHPAMVAQSNAPDNSAVGGSHSANLIEQVAADSALLGADINFAEPEVGQIQGQPSMTPMFAAMPGPAQFYQGMPPVMMAQMPGAPLPLGQPGAGPMPQYITPVSGAMGPARYDQPNMPDYAWPGYAAHPNYAGVTYPKQYSPTAWPYIGPFYPYPQVPLGWRKITLEWHDGWWQLDFCDSSRTDWFSGLFRPHKKK